MFRLFAPRARAVDALMPSEEESRRRLLSSIRASMRQPSLTSPQPTEFSYRPMLIGAGLLTVSTCALFFIVSPSRRPAMTPDAVLARAAEMEDAQQPQAQPGVIFERVKIQTAGQTAGQGAGQRFEWPVYRDRQGKRKPHFQLTVEHETALEERLAAAGITRENPLSAASFRSWRDRFSTHTDSVAYSSSGLITVTTTIPAISAGPVREETLTLRDGDFHPLARTVAFRDDQTVELAELDYRVLNWNQVQREWFDNPSQPIVLVPRQPSIAGAATPASMTAPTESQLILAELQTRTILSNLNADINEQIEIIHQPDAILVRGLASTPERKQQLQAALAIVSHISLDLSTPEERAASEASSALTPSTSLKQINVQQINVQSMDSVSQPSPLLLYWKSEHRSPEEFPRASGQLLDSALRISQQSRALRDLAQEFATKPRLDAPARQAYDALWSDHEQKLSAAIADQVRILKSLALSPPAPTLPATPVETSFDPAPLTAADDLDRMASISLKLCRELTAGEESGQREALPILADLTDETAMISSVLNRLSASTAQIR